MRIYDFEQIDGALLLVPLAARRAMDAAGIKVSLAAWTAATLDARRAVAALGSEARVDAAEVTALIARWDVTWSSVPPIGDPSAEEVPGELARIVTLEVWRGLSALDRYALWKVAMGKHPDDVLPRARDEIVPLSTHLDARGEARMVDVGAKQVTARRAVARARVTMQEATVARLRAGDPVKGDVLATARIAGIQAAKRTPELIPLCHSVALTRVIVDFAIVDGGVEIEATAEARDRTGVEMEALTAASVAALTVYDMLKGVDRGMRFTVELSYKHGGKTGEWTREEPPTA